MHFDPKSSSSDGQTLKMGLLGAGAGWTWGGSSQTPQARGAGRDPLGLTHCLPAGDGRLVSASWFLSGLGGSRGADRHTLPREGQSWPLPL